MLRLRSHFCPFPGFFLIAFAVTFFRYGYLPSGVSFLRFPTATWIFFKGVASSFSLITDISCVAYCSSCFLLSVFLVSCSAVLFCLSVALSFLVFSRFCFFLSLLLVLSSEFAFFPAAFALVFSSVYVCPWVVVFLTHTATLTYPFACSLLFSRRHLLFSRSLISLCFAPAFLSFLVGCIPH